MRFPLSELCAFQVELGFGIIVFPSCNNYAHLDKALSELMVVRKYYNASISDDRPISCHVYIICRVRAHKASDAALHRPPPNHTMVFLFYAPIEPDDEIREASKPSSPVISKMGRRRSLSARIADTEASLVQPDLPAATPAVAVEAVDTPSVPWKPSPELAAQCRDLSPEEREELYDLERVNDARRAAVKASPTAVPSAEILESLRATDLFGVATVVRDRKDVMSILDMCTKHFASAVRDQSVPFASAAAAPFEVSATPVSSTATIPTLLKQPLAGVPFIMCSTVDAFCETFTATNGGALVALTKAPPQTAMELERLRTQGLLWKRIRWGLSHAFMFPFTANSDGAQSKSILKRIRSRMEHFSDEDSGLEEEDAGIVAGVRASMIAYTFVLSMFIDEEFGGGILNFFKVFEETVVAHVTDVIHEELRAEESFAICDFTLLGNMLIAQAGNAPASEGKGKDEEEEEEEEDSNQTLHIGEEGGKLTILSLETPLEVGPLLYALGSDTTLTVAIMQKFALLVQSDLLVDFSESAADLNKVCRKARGNHPNLGEVVRALGDVPQTSTLCLTAIETISTTVINRRIWGFPIKPITARGHRVSMNLTETMAASAVALLSVIVCSPMTLPIVLAPVELAAVPRTLHEIINERGLAHLDRNSRGAVTVELGSEGGEVSDDEGLHECSRPTKRKNHDSDDSDDDWDDGGEDEDSASEGEEAVGDSSDSDWSDSDGESDGGGNSDSDSDESVKGADGVVAYLTKLPPKQLRALIHRVSKKKRRVGSKKEEE